MSYTNFFNPSVAQKRVKLNIRAKRIAGEGSVWHTRNQPRDAAENNSIMIESKAIADSMRQAYELSWLGAKTIEI